MVHDRKRSLNSMKLGLKVVLASTLLFNYSSIDIKAETGDDLKASLGFEVKEEKQTTTIVNNEKNSTKMESSTAKDNVYSINESIKSIEKRLESALNNKKNTMKASNIIIMIKNIKDKKNELNEAKKLAELEDILNKDYTMYQNENIKERIDIDNMNFEIGTIGNKAISPIKNYFKLVTPYGYKLNSDGSHEPKNPGIDLAGNNGDSVLAQWNGIVVEVIKDEEIPNSKKVTIYHGRGIYTIYHHIELENGIILDSEVKQGDKIGVVANTKTIEKDKINHIYYQIVIDNKFINPLLIFGSRGEKAYNEYLKTTNYVYAVAEDEHYYYNDDMKKENPNKDKEEKSKEEDEASLIEGYSRPDPGVVG